MTLAIVDCPLCAWEVQAHGYARKSVLREHIRVVHPEAEAEIREFEVEMRARRSALRAKYGKNFHLSSI